MKYFDAHAHVFEALKGYSGKGEMTALGGGKGAWATGEVCKMIPPALGEDAFTYDTAYQLLKDNDVEKAVLLQGSYYGFQNDYVSKAVNAHPDMFIGAGTFDPFAMYAEKLYDRLTHELGFRVLKFETSSGCGLMSYHDAFSVREVFSPIAEKCAKNGQILVLDIGSPGMGSFQPDGVREIADRYPELRVVVCHLLAPTRKDGEALKVALELLARDNIYFDLSAVPFNVQPEKYPYPTGLEFIACAKNIVGYDKLMWGTDIPSVLWYDTYANLRDYLMNSDVFTDAEKQAVFHDTASRVFCG